MSFDYTAGDTWDMEATKSGSGGDFELCPAGNYPAQIVALIDVGTHEETNQEGETYDSRKLIIAVEITKKSSKGARFIISQLYTWSMRDNSNWYKLVCALTGKRFAEGERFDPRQVLGMPCMANIVHRESKKKAGRFFHVLGGVAQYPEDLPQPDAAGFRPAVAWSVREGNPMNGLGWVPNVYFGNGMHSPEKIASMSKEARGYSRPQTMSVKPANPAEAMADQIQESIKESPTQFNECA